VTRVPKRYSWSPSEGGDPSDERNPDPGFWLESRKEVQRRMLFFRGGPLILKLEESGKPKEGLERSREKRTLSTFSGAYCY